MASKRDSVGAFLVPDKDHAKAYPADSEKAKDARRRQAENVKGGPIRGDVPLHPTETVDQAHAYDRADGTQQKKER
jgi:hypothetical protein